MRSGALLLVLCVAVAGCGAAGGGVRAEGAAPTAIPWRGDTYVLDYKSVPWDAPESLSLTPFTWLSHLTWKSWGGNRAVANGFSWDMECVSGCAADGIPSYRVTVVLTDLERRAHAAYYHHASVLPAGGAKVPAWAEAGVDDLTLHVPGS